jgi:transcriptional regulator with XRE-family HTH domain
LEIGEKIRRLRERKGWPQKKLAQKVGISPSVFNRIELGQRPVRSDELKDICEALEVEVSFLLGEEHKDSQEVKNDSVTTIRLIEEEAKKLGLSTQDPLFQKMLSDAFDLLRIARGKDGK